MKIRIVETLVLLICCTLGASGAPSDPSFTYQGRLTESGHPANGLYEMSFTLFDAPTNGNQVGDTVNLTSLPVSNGLFAAQLDFRSGVFDGTARWLEIMVNLSGSNALPVTLSPRQALAPTPYALHAVNAGGLISFEDMPLEIKVNGQRALRLESTSSIDTVNVIGGSARNFVTVDVVGATIAGGGGINNNSVRASYASIGGGHGNNIGTNSWQSTIAGGRANDVGSNSYSSTIGGGELNWISTGSPHSVVAGGYYGRIANGSGASAIGGGFQNTIASYSGTIAGGFYNTIGTNSLYGTISGGEDNHLASNARNSSIAGGRRNDIGMNSQISAIGGGEDNNIEPGSYASSIAGGSYNDIGSNSAFAVIGGGNNNDIRGNSASSCISGGTVNGIGANSSYSAIGGGFGNTVGENSSYATIPGGNNNFATNGAFAAGTGAKAQHSGAFVWSDSSLGNVVSTNVNSVTMRAAGGYRFFSSSNLAAGVFLASGGGGWTAISDRDTKQNFAAVNVREILDKVAALPLSTWNYKSQESSIRHIGPTAQDFKAAFGVGETDLGITTIDADGVALAAIQGLNRKVEEQAAQLRAKEAELQSIRQRLLRVEGILKAPNGNEE